MKQALIILTLLLSQVAMAQSLKEMRVKQEMLDRADLIISKVETVREILKVKKHEIPSEENMTKACETLESLYKIFPDHLTEICENMDLFSPKTIWMKYAATDQLMFIHKQVRNCRKGNDHEYVDPTAIRKEFEYMVKSLKKQRKRILKEDTDFDNSYHIEYEI